MVHTLNAYVAQYTYLITGQELSDEVGGEVRGRRGQKLEGNLITG